MHGLDVKQLLTKLHVRSVRRLGIPVPSKGEFSVRAGRRGGLSGQPHNNRIRMKPEAIASLPPLTRPSDR